MMFLCKFNKYRIDIAANQRNTANHTKGEVMYIIDG